MDIGLKDNEGRAAAVEAMVDDGAMVAAMDTEVYKSLRSEIGGWKLTQRKFRMANGTIVPGEASWGGCINVKGVEVDGEFEVFDSGGSWKFLFGKPLLEQFLAVHDYGKESIVLRGKQGKWGEVFNGRLGAAITPEAIPVLEDRSQQDIPRPNAQAQVVLEESAEPAGGVTVKALTPLDREVTDLCSTAQSSAQAYNKPGVTNDTPGWNMGADEEDWQVTEAELEEWLREARMLRREETIKRQEELECRQREWRTVWEKEEEQRDAEWAAWLRHQCTEPGLRKWFFWRNRFKNLGSPRRLRVETLGGDNAPPSREVSDKTSLTDPQHADRAQTAPICVIQTSEDYPGESDMGLDFFLDALDQSEDVNLFMPNDGEKGAFRPERVKEILRKVKIGPNLSMEQRAKVEHLLSTYTDCFALYVGEVRPVKNVIHHLNIPEGTTFPKKVQQKSLIPPQCEYLHAKVDELLEAGVIERCNPEDVKCVSPLTLAQKAHEGTGLTVEELMHKLNDKCVATGLPASFDLPTHPGHLNWPSGGYVKISWLSTSSRRLRQCPKAT
ncbi:hypothetical protein F5876DRAFT_84586 [Lentinula aff. lateritia]|uniref:Uncharacterized protein n=1 Tax=Lentinula aff. lateritia TaxID=2804960 RepID=A0ACC1TGD8_9AGAR|nr:hypothetical protein F5876DRAFT_84586 [Lentinula aff. lateritia]